MKWTSVTVAALASAATACTVDLGNEVTCPTKTYDNVVANFDDKANDHVLGIYHHLNFNDITVKHQGSGDKKRGLIPRTRPNFGIVPKRGQFDDTILSLTNTTSTSFDFFSLYAGCISPTNTVNGYKAVPCTISIDCATTLSMEGHLGPQAFEFKPSKDFGNDMKFMKTDGYKFCQELTIDVTPSDAVVVLDDVKYTVREGECIPNSPGFPECQK